MLGFQSCVTFQASFYYSRKFSFWCGGGRCFGLETEPWYVALAALVLLVLLKLALNSQQSLCHTSPECAGIKEEHHHTQTRLASFFKGISFGSQVPNSQSPECLNLPASAGTWRAFLNLTGGLITTSLKRPMDTWIRISFPFLRTKIRLNILLEWHSKIYHRTFWILMFTFLSSDFSAINFKAFLTYSNKLKTSM